MGLCVGPEVSRERFQKVWYGGLGVGGGQLERIGRVEGEGRVGVEFKKQS